MKKLELWCYGGGSKAFFIEQSDAIYQYNAKMMDRLLLIMTIIVGTFFAGSTGSRLFSKYTNVYLVCFIVLLFLFVTFKLKAYQSKVLTKIYIFLFSSTIFTFVWVLGALMETDTRATLFIVYVLIIPMLFIIPTHHTYIFVALTIAIFSITALEVKVLDCAQMDIVHSITCMILGLFVSHHILASRIALYIATGQMDKRNAQLKSEIEERKQEQEELRLILEQHQIIMNQTTDILFEWDIAKDTLDFSPNWRKKFGYEPINRDISGLIPLSEDIHPEDMPAFVKIMKDTAAGKPYSETEFRIKECRGRYRWCRIRATTQYDSEGRAIKAVGVILDINAEKKEKQNLLKMAQRDALTGIYNKAATNAMVVRRMKDFDFTVLQALMIIDVDYFKAVNDTYGHMAGDNILSAVATQLKHHVRTNDIVGRIGGDEFLVYLAEVENEDTALWKAQNIHAALGILAPEPGVAPISCSIGMAVFPHASIEYSDLYRYADEALYQRKESGRNGITVYDNTKK